MVPNNTTSMLWLTRFIIALGIMMIATTTNAGAAENDEQVPPPHDSVFPTSTLHNGMKLPLVGLGCASGVKKKHVVSAINIGYRLIDTAQSHSWGYREEDVGYAIHSSLVHDVNRNDIFIQSKIHPENLGYDATKKAFDVSLQRLNVDKLDSMLIHKPHCWEGACTKQPEGTWEESWIALEELVEQDKVSCIGICDVSDTILNKLLQQKIKPHIIQNWMDPFHQDKHIRKRCKEHNIQYQAYSSLGTQWFHHRGYTENPVLNNPILMEIANKYNTSVPNVVVNWSTRHGVSVLPASTSSSHQKSNLINSFIFDLTDDEMTQIDELDGTLERPKPKLKNPNEISITFTNYGDETIMVYWYNSDSEEEIHNGEIDSNDSLTLTTFHGHKFIFKALDEETEEETYISEHVVNGHDGKSQNVIVNDIHIEL